MMVMGMDVQTEEHPVGISVMVNGCTNRGAPCRNECDGNGCTNRGAPCRNEGDGNGCTNRGAPCRNEGDVNGCKQRSTLLA